MAFTTFTSIPDTSIANTKIWGQGITTALDTVGNPKTADTGQVDWTTYNSAPSPATYPAYEIRRFNDSLQSAAPIFYKLELGAAGNAATPGVRLTVGTGSNGTGTVTGNKTGLFTPGGSSGSTTVSANSLLCGASNRITCALFGDGTFQSAGMHFAIERTKDSLGNDTTEGALITVISASSLTGAVTKISQFLPFVGGVPAADVLGSIGSVNGNGTDGADVITCPNFPFRGSGIMNPGLNVEYYMNASVNAGTVAPIERYGISRNYYFIGNNTSFAGMLRGNAAWIAGSTLAIRWD